MRLRRQQPPTLQFTKPDELGFSIFLDTHTLREDNPAKLRFPLRGGVCIAHHHFVASQFSRARRFSSSTATKLLATCGPEFCRVMASRYARLTVSPERDFCGDPMSTT